MAKKKEKTPITINITNPSAREGRPALEEVALEQYEIAPDPSKSAPMAPAKAKARRDAAVRLLTKALKKGKGKKKKGRRHRVS